MKTVNQINDVISDAEYNLAKYKFIRDKFPDVTTFDATGLNRVFTYGFRSKIVNSKYTDFEFHNFANRNLYILPYYKLEFSHNGKSEIIKVHSSPTKMSLAYIEHDYTDLNYTKTIRFSKFQNSFKKNNISDLCLKDCQIQILDFIKNNAGAKLDDKNLSPKIKKLLLFT